MVRSTEGICLQCTNSVNMQSYTMSETLPTVDLLLGLPDGVLLHHIMQLIRNWASPCSSALHHLLTIRHSVCNGGKTRLDEYKLTANASISLKHCNKHDCHIETVLLATQELHGLGFKNMCGPAA